AQSLEAHGYHRRWIGEALRGRVLQIAVRRFFCRCCIVPINFLHAWRSLAGSCVTQPSKRFSRAEPFGVTCGLGGTFRALPARLPALVWETARGVRGVVRSVPTGGSRWFSGAGSWRPVAA